MPVEWEVRGVAVQTGLSVSDVYLGHEQKVIVNYAYILRGVVSFRQ